MKKYQILTASYLLFTIPFLAQSNYSLSIYNESNNDICYYSLQNNIGGETAIENFNNDSILDDIYVSNDNTIYHNLDFKVSYQNEKVIDSKTDSLHNVYKLSFENNLLTIQKFSPEQTLIWEYTIMSFDTTMFVPIGITLLNDDKIFIACYKRKDPLKKNIALYCINSEGDFQNEIVFK